MRRLLVLLLVLAGCTPPMRHPSVQERCQAVSRPDICELIGTQVEADEAQRAVAYQPSDSGHIVIPPNGQPWVWVPPGGHVVIPPGHYGRGQWVGVGP